MVVAEGSVLEMFKLYIGNGSLMLLFVVALIYLWSTKGEKSMKNLLLYSSVGVLCLFFFPPLSHVIINVLGEGEVYYRLLWMLPMGIVIPYALVLHVSKYKKKWLGYLVVALVCGYIAVGGNLVYNAPQLTRAQNAYQIPDEVIEICDAIQVPGREVKALFPHELIQYVRQYSAFVVMPYGYESIVPRWNFYDELETEMRKETSDGEVLCGLAREEGCHYIILNKAHFMDGTPEEQGYQLFYETVNYKVYLDENADLDV
ncbi:MAG: hypothetical protein IJ291_02515 [Lachnospiraceae bacterium]|nr:hypothetical protein [Lachnospiraceae bacterium]